MTVMRADRLLVERGYFDSRTAAQAAILAGHVRADGQAVARPAQRLAWDCAVEARPAHPYVSRGALKLAHALEVFGLDAAGRAVLDIGASTGGFTQVLLEAGARHVVAVDVGHGQLHARLAEDPRVTRLEARDARSLTREDLPEPPCLLVCDASFIGLEKLLARPLDLAAPGADLVALFKPQFQVGRAHVGRGGVVRDGAAVSRAAEALSDWLSSAGWPVQGWCESPIAGGDGNRERLVHATHRPE